MKFAYQAQKLSQARRALMLPHPRSEAEGIAGAFLACSLAFNNFDPDTLDYNARGWFSKITELMDTSGIADPLGRGTWANKAEEFTTDQKTELSRAIDELGHWFEWRASGNC